MIAKYISEHIRVASVMLALTFSSLALEAQVFPSLLLNQDPVSLSKGSSGVADKAGAFALQNNVAAMSLADARLSAKAGFGLWQPSFASEKTIGVAGMYRVSDKVGIGAEFKYLMLPSYDGVTGNGSDIRDSRFSPNEFNVAAGVSYAFIDCLSAGLTLRCAGSKLAPETSATVFGADVGMFFRKKGVTAGISVNNLGTKAKYGETAYAQPMLFKAGAGYDLALGSSSLAFTAEFDMLFTGSVMAGAGLGYSFKDMVSVRAGYHYGDAVDAVPSYASAGLGLKFFGVSLDVSWLFASKVLANTMAISLGYSF